MQLEVLVQTMKTTFHTTRWAVLAAGLLISVSAVRSQDNSKTPSSYMPVDIHESFSTIMNRMTAAKPEIMQRHMALLEQRYDLSNRPAPGVKMSGGKAIQQAGCRQLYLVYRPKRDSLACSIIDQGIVVDQSSVCASRYD